MIGSTWMMRARRSTAQIASIPAMAARTSCRFTSAARPRAKGWKTARSPTDQAKNEGLVDRRVEGYGVALLADEPRHRAAIRGETRRQIAARRDPHRPGSRSGRGPRALESRAAAPPRRMARAMRNRTAPRDPRGASGRRPAPSGCRPTAGARNPPPPAGHAAPPRRCPAAAVDIDVGRGFISRDPEGLKQPFQAGAGRAARVGTVGEIIAGLPSAFGATARVKRTTPYRS